VADALSSPGRSAALVEAVYWVQGTLLGTFATTVAVIAIAWIGFGMLSGRINLQRGAVVILGCFIVFGAPMIGAGLIKVGGAVGERDVVVAIPSAPPPPPRPTSSPIPYDPYAGASVPVR
jgi:type IV secretion system protein VirB2